MSLLASGNVTNLFFRFNFSDQVVPDEVGGEAAERWETEHLKLQDDGAALRRLFREQVPPLSELLASCAAFPLHFLCL